MQTPLTFRGQFASDNYSGMCPEALEWLIAANEGHALAYGNDTYTLRACDALRELFETDCDVFFVTSGTAANALALATLCKSYQSVVCHEFAHVETDECGAPEFFSNGTKLLLVQGTEGKVWPRDVDSLIHKRSDLHFPQPSAITISQATEVGTIYGLSEILALSEICHRHGLKVHMDGARFANAVATLGVSPKELSWQAGVDVLTFGGAKNGLAFGEAIIFFDRKLSDGFSYRCKQAGQLISKLRFVTAPWIGLLESGAWLRNASHANRMARQLANQLESVNGVDLMYPPEANSIFVQLTTDLRDSLRQRGWHFYEFIGAGGVRLMCSWNTTEQDIEMFISDLHARTRTDDNLLTQSDSPQSALSAKQQL